MALLMTPKFIHVEISIVHTNMYGYLGTRIGLFNLKHRMGYTYWYWVRLFQSTCRHVLLEARSSVRLCWRAMVVIGDCR